MSIVLLSLGAGCLWQGLLIIWVAPTPSQFRSTTPPPDAAAAFQVFWLDQYAWIGIALIVLGTGLCLLGVL